MKISPTICTSLQLSTLVVRLSKKCSWFSNSSGIWQKISSTSAGSIMWMFSERFKGWKNI